MPGIGPELPPHLRNVAPSVEDEDDEDDYVPELPPHLIASRSSNTAKPSTLNPNPNSNPARKRVQGPSFPGPADDDSDDDIGPKPLPPSASGSVSVEKDAIQEFIEKEENRRKKIEEAKNPSAPKREEWMLIPPSSSDLLGKLDPTKLSKPRQFSRSTAPARPSSSTDMSLWTETPAERQQRLADEVSGKRRRPTAPEEVNAGDEEERKKRKVYDEELRKGVEEHTRRYRGPALVEAHRSKHKDDEDSKESRIWEHGRDMGISGRLMDDYKRDQMIRESKGLSSRFAGASTGNFL